MSRISITINFMKKQTNILIFILVLSVLIFTNCESNTDSTPKNTVPIDSLQATISGEYNMDFHTTGVNLLTMSKTDTTAVYLLSGTMLVSPLEVYSVYILINWKDGQYEIDLAGTDGQTRFEFTAGATTLKVNLGFDVEGKVNITENSKHVLAGTFEFKAKTPEKDKSITVSNGIFYYTDENR